MKVLCCDSSDYKSLFVLDVCASYYDADVHGLVLVPYSDSFDTFCFPDIDVDYCNALIFELYHDNVADFRSLGEIQLYSDIVGLLEDSD